MFVSINGQRLMSFDQFEKAFREAFEREMTVVERAYFTQTDFSDCVVQRDESFVRELVTTARKTVQLTMV